MARLSAETLNIDRLKRAAGFTVFERGQAYYQWGRVRVERIEPKVALCYVQGRHLYEVELRISDEDNVLYLKCECEYAKRGTICKHEVAACLAVREQIVEQMPPPWTDLLNKVLRTPVRSARRVKPRPYLLFFSLQEVPTLAQSNWKIVPVQLYLSALPEGMRDLQNIPGEQLQTFIENTPNLAMQARTPMGSFNLKGCANCPLEGVLLANLILERIHSASSLYLYSYSRPPLDTYLSSIADHGCPLYLGTSVNPLETALHILNEPGELHIRLARVPGGLNLGAWIALGENEIPVLPEGRERSMKMIYDSPYWVLAEREVFRLENDPDGAQLSNWLDEPQLFIPQEEENEFLERYLLSLARQLPLESELIGWETIAGDPVPRLYLSEVKGKLQAQLRFAYSGYEVSYETDPAEETILRQGEGWNLVRIQRQIEREEEYYRSLSTSSFRLKRGPKTVPAGTFLLRANAHPIDFLMYSIPQLIQAGFEIYGEERLKTAHVNRNKPTISFNVSSGIDWFDVQAVVSFGELQVSLKDLRKALRKKQRYIKLGDGSIGELPEEWIERYKHLFALGEESEAGLRMSRAHVTLIDELIQGANLAHVDEEFKRRRQRLRDFSGITPVPLPGGFVGELRPYQKAGYDWLHFLYEYEFGGCLADDMGLGKTIQVLVFLQSLREGLSSQAGHQPPTHADLIVVPRSLLVNWQREAARFTPNLHLLEYFEAERPKDPTEFDRYDVLITTYGIMLRDIDLLKNYPFNLILLDESQAIKNPLSQTARAARQLRSRHRLVLTGTPVENSTIELWSQFAFLNPGLLGSLDYFKSEFGTRIEKKGDERAAQLLRQMVYPFILRRTKDQVAPELPPRSERILYSDMEPSQLKLYHRTRDLYRGMVMGLLEKEGLNSTRMKILEGLLRLRQIANHPSLVDGKFRGDSGKFDLLLETLETLQAEGHKALVFSQFVQMLQLVRSALDQRGIPYMYMDGHTQNRQERVDAFQNDPSIPLFLISLRAGGVGLNLTAADYVIHIDPWWNPAVEMQATDRTHRIGQDKPVFVYKLITRDTVEEKILQLQERKKELVDQLITTESSFLKSMTQSDVEVLFS